MAFSVEQNDVYHVGTDHVMDFTVTSDGTTPVDITAATPINWELRTHALSLTQILAKTGTVTDGPGGVFRITLAPADSIATRVYAMQVEMTLSSEKSIVAEGSFHAKPRTIT